MVDGETDDLAVLDREEIGHLVNFVAVVGLDLDGDDVVDNQKGPGMRVSATHSRQEFTEKLYDIIDAAHVPDVAADEFHVICEDCTEQGEISRADCLA